MLDTLKREPVRVYIYSNAAALLALLVALGVIEAHAADAILTLVGAAVVVAGTEKARSKVSPVG